MDTLAAIREKPVLRRAQSVSTLDIGFVLQKLTEDREDMADDAISYNYEELKAQVVEALP